MNPELFPFRNLEWRRWFHRYTTPRDWKKGARDVPFGLGAKTLYVDGDNGNDHNDGLSWKTAFKTIQHAIDEADSWSNIFIKAATYPEEVEVSKNDIVLIGESRDSVIIQPSSGYPVYITGNNCSIISLSPIVPSNEAFCVYITGDYAKLDNLKLDGVAGSGGILAEGSDEVIIRHVFASNSNLAEGISLALGTSHVEVSHNVLNLTYSTGVGYVLYLDDVSDSKIFENDFGALPSGEGLFISNNASDLTIFHNNFLDNNTQVENYGSNITFLENYFSDHTNTDNGFGIATDPYTFTGGSDPRPVVSRNGWLALSWADADLVSKIKAVTDNLPDNGSLNDLAAIRAVTDNLPDSGSLNDLATILSNQKKYWHWNAISGDYRVITGTWELTSQSSQYLGCALYNSSAAQNDEIAVPFFARSTDSLTLYVRCRTCSSCCILTVYVDGQSQGTIDFYSSSDQYNVIKSISITPARAGLNVFRLKVTDKNASSTSYYALISEMWLG